LFFPSPWLIRLVLIGNECFAAFKTHYGKDWKKVLEVRDKISTEKATNQSGHRRAAEFNKFSKNISKTAAKGHVVGFETVTLTVGSKLHHDQGLGVIVESEGPRGVRTSFSLFF
jgi:hypothetical protein